MNQDDEQAFTEWATARLALLMRFGFALTHDEAAAEDLVQTALVRTLLAWSRLRNQDDPEPYNAGWKGDIAPWFARLPDHGA